MKKLPLKVGDIAQVTFLDHCHAGGEEYTNPIEFRVYGEVIYIAPTHIIVASWVEPNGHLDKNTEAFTIVRSAIKKVRRLK